MHGLSRYLPVLDWGRRYDRATLSADLLAAVIVTIMLIPQSLAYAMLAGLPAEVGVYASILPIVGYAIFGTSRTLAVGPVAVVSLMTAAAIARTGAEGEAALAVALVLALLSGLMLFAAGVMKLGFLANFLPHPVTAGFITASAFLIAASQLGHVLGVKLSGDNLIELGEGLVAALGGLNPVTAAIGAGTLAFLFWARSRLKPLLRRLGLGPRLADALTKAAPILAVAVTSALAWGLDLGSRGVALVGSVAGGLPPLTLPALSLDLVRDLALPALLISLVGFVESVSVGQTLAAKRRQRIEPDQELLGLGAANIAASFTGGMPVTGGFARSIVNFDAGAATQAAGLFTAVGLLLTALFLTPLLAFLPKATLAAMIIVAVLGLVNLRILAQAWAYSRTDFAAVALTILVTLAAGVEAGLVVGVLVALVAHLHATSRPHIAEVGHLPGTHHFRNVLRHEVVTDPSLLSVRVDERLYFANARFLEDYLLTRIAEMPGLRHVVLLCSAVNDVDLSAAESLLALNQRLKDAGVTLHLSEVKGPVMDKLAKSHLPRALTGKIYLSQVDAVRDLAPAIAPAPLQGVA